MGATIAEAGKASMTVGYNQPQTVENISGALRNQNSQGGCFGRINLGGERWRGRFM